jgi:hypothetical protein
LVDLFVTVFSKVSFGIVCVCTLTENLIGQQARCKMIHFFGLKLNSLSHSLKASLRACGKFIRLKIHFRNY